MQNPWVEAKLLDSLEAAESKGLLTPSVLSNTFLREDLSNSLRARVIRSKVYTSFLPAMPFFHQSGADDHNIPQELAIAYAKALFRGESLEEAEDKTALYGYSEALEFHTAAKAAKRLTRMYAERKASFTETSTHAFLVVKRRYDACQLIRKYANASVNNTVNLGFGQFIVGTAPYYGFDSNTASGVFVLPDFIGKRLLTPGGIPRPYADLFKVTSCTAEQAQSQEVCEMFATLVRDEVNPLNANSLTEMVATATALAT